MGIFKRTIYDMCCHGCGKCYSDTTNEFYPDEDCLRFEAEESGWKEIDGEWYCPECWYVDDNDKLQVVKR